MDGGWAGTGGAAGVEESFRQLLGSVYAQLASCLYVCLFVLGSVYTGKKAHTELSVCSACGLNLLWALGLGDCDTYI